jgi:phosphoserine aminotransferase
LIAVDAVSSLPYPDFDCTQLDSVFFSVQKCFGLPAVLGVWIINDRCMTKAASLVSKGISVGSYHTIQSLHTHAVKNQTPETPNVLGIFLLNKVVQDFLSRGIDIIRKETEHKTPILYQVLEQHKLLSSFVQDKNVRPKTVIVANCGVHTERPTQFLIEKSLHPREGYGAFKKQHLRFANFPAHSTEQYEMLVDVLDAFQ